MTKSEILNTFFDINEDACKAIYNNDLKELDMFMNNIYSSSFLSEDNYKLVLQAFRLANMKLSMIAIIKEIFTIELFLSVLLWLMNTQTYIKN